MNIKPVNFVSSEFYKSVSDEYAYGEEAVLSPDILADISDLSRHLAYYHLSGSSMSLSEPGKLTLDIFFYISQNAYVSVPHFRKFEMYSKVHSIYAKLQERKDPDLPLVAVNRLSHEFCKEAHIDSKYESRVYNTFLPIFTTEYVIRLPRISIFRSVSNFFFDTIDYILDIIFHASGASFSRATADRMQTDITNGLALLCHNCDPSYAGVHISPI